MIELHPELLGETLVKIRELCRIPSPSGYTHLAIEYLTKTFIEMGYKPTLTNKNALLVDLGGKGNPVVLAAHIDTLGAMVRSIKGNGRLRLTKIGSYPENNIEGENCLLFTRFNQQYTGTIQMVNPAVHVNSKLGATQRDDTNVELVLDEKVKSAADVKKLGIDHGDFVAFDPRTVITKTGFIKSRHLDDKASAGILISLAQYLQDKKLKRKVYLMFTNYEEVGHGASAGVPVDTKEMISVDMGAVGDDLKTDEHTVSICAKDSGGPYDNDLTTRLILLAKEHKINYAVDIYPFYGSDVEAALRAGYDIRHGLIGPGVAASHGYERSHKDGIAATLQLLIAYLQ